MTLWRCDSLNSKYNFNRKIRECWSSVKTLLEAPTSFIMGNMIGIYIIKNIENFKTYVGQSSDIQGRFRRHISALKNNAHANKNLQEDWNLFGEKAFIFSVLEECSPEDLSEREIYYIAATNSFSLGYNMNIGGDGIRGYRHSAEEITKMRNIQSPLAVLQFDTDFHLVNRWEGGISHISKALNYTHACLVLRCRHTMRGKMTPYKGYYWVYEKEYEHPDFSWINYLRNQSCLQFKDILDIKHNVNIVQYDLDGTLIRIWTDQRDLLDADFNLDRIRMICRHHSGQWQTHKGFIWRFAE